MSQSWRASVSLTLTMSTCDRTSSERIALVIDPVVHRVERDRFRRAHAAAASRAGSRDRCSRGTRTRCRRTRAGTLRLPVGEHAKLRVDRLRGVHRVVVLAQPAERLSGAPLETREVDAACAQALDVLLEEVIADDAHQPHRRVEARGDREIRCRAAEHVGPMLDGRLHVVVRERTDDEDVRPSKTPARRACR